MIKTAKITILLLFFSFVSVCLAEDITFTVVYNNVPYSKDLTTSWGISIFIDGLEKDILFDAGGSGSILLSNMEKLKIDPRQIDIVVLSHIHGDHVGGLNALAERNSNLSVYLPASFPSGFKSSLARSVREVIPVKGPVKVCQNVFSTGELDTWIKEQSLVIETQKGLIIITGCAHPGIVNIVKYVKNRFNKKVYLVLGGFHLMAYSEDQVNQIIKELKELGVEKVGPSHCTGGRPIDLFKKAWGEDFIDLGCGAKIEITL